MIKECKEVLFTHDQIQNEVKKIGKEITEFYRGKDLVVVGILKGAAPFMMDLIKEIKMPLEYDFIQVSSYEGTTSGQLRFKKDLDVDIRGRDVLFVDDIVDTGKSATVITNLYKDRGANSIEFACLLDKKENRQIPYEPRFVCFEIPNHFVIGYGLDYNEKFRNLDYIGIFDTKYC